MARLVDTVERGAVIVAVAENERREFEVGFHRRDETTGEWTVGVFNEEHLPFLVAAVHRVYALLRQEEAPSPSDLLRARVRARNARSREQWDGNVRRAKSAGAIEPPRRIP